MNVLDVMAQLEALGTQQTKKNVYSPWCPWPFIWSENWRLKKISCERS